MWCGEVGGWWEEVGAMERGKAPCSWEGLRHVGHGEGEGEFRC